MRVHNLVFLTVAALASGVVAGACLPRWPVMQDWAGRLSGRGKLVAFVHGVGFYDADVDAEFTYAEKRGAEPASRVAVVRELIAKKNLEFESANEAIDSAEVQRQFDLLYDQFADPNRWTKAMNESGLSERDLRASLRQALQARQFLEKKIAGDLRKDDSAIEQYFREHAEEFSQPARFRASHLFLAAPVGSPADLIESKRLQIEALDKRLAAGEDFAQLVAAASEDEATKNKGGDLGWYSIWRMPPDFFQPVAKLKVGETTRPLHTSLGFHIVRLTDQHPSGALGFADAQTQIADHLQDEKRARAVAAIEAHLGRETLWFRP